MPQLTLSLVGADGAVRGTSTGTDLAQLDTRYAEYQPGDVLVLTSDEKNFEL